MTGFIQIKIADGEYYLDQVEIDFFSDRVEIISGKNIFNQKSLFECIKNYYLIENSELKGYLEKANTLLKPELTKEGSFEPIIKEIKNGSRI